MTPKYRAEVVVIPVKADDARAALSSMVGQLGGLASLAGLALPSGGNKDEYLQYLQSSDFTGASSRTRSCCRCCSPTGGTPTRGRWTVDDPDDVPTMADGVRLFDRSIRVRPGRTSHRNRHADDGVDGTASWRRTGPTCWSSAVNRDLRQRADRRGAGEHRLPERRAGQDQRRWNCARRIYRLLENQIKTVMLANVRDQYAFKVIDPAVAPDADDVVRPRKRAMILLGAVFGGVVGAHGRAVAAAPRAAVSQPTAGSLAASPPSILLALLYALALVGFPLASTLPTVLGVGSQVVTVPFRLLVIALTGGALYLCLLRRRARHAGCGGATCRSRCGCCCSAACSSTRCSTRCRASRACRSSQYMLLSIGAVLPAGASRSCRSRRPRHSTRAAAHRGAGRTRAGRRCCTSACGVSFDGRIFRRLSTEILNPISVGHLGASVFAGHAGRPRDLAGHREGAAHRAHRGESRGRRRLGVARADRRCAAPGAAARAGRPGAPGPQHRRPAGADRADRRRHRARSSQPSFHRVQHKGADHVALLRRRSAMPRRRSACCCSGGAWQQFAEQPLFGHVVRRAAAHDLPAQPRARDADGHRASLGVALLLLVLLGAALAGAARSAGGRARRVAGAAAAAVPDRADVLRLDPARRPVLGNAVRACWRSTPACAHRGAAAGRARPGAAPRAAALPAGRDMIGIVDYGVGNLGSILNMYRKLGIAAATVGDPAALAAADRLILPGIGAFDACVTRLRDVRASSNHCSRRSARGVPLLGICVGMQMLTAGSEEGSLPGPRPRSRRVRSASSRRRADLKVPHMGWNEVRWTGARPAGRGARGQARVSTSCTRTTSSATIRRDQLGTARLRPRVRGRHPPRPRRTACSSTPRRAIASGCGCSATSRAHEHASAPRHSLPAAAQPLAGEDAAVQGPGVPRRSRSTRSRSSTTRKSTSWSCSTSRRRPTGGAPNFEFIAEFASECFMPLAYGGGITQPGARGAAVRDRRREGRDQHGRVRAPTW